jgi:hypothetical protein
MFASPSEEEKWHRSCGSTLHRESACGRWSVDDDETKTGNGMVDETF